MSKASITNILVNTTDLCDIFAPYVSGTKASTTNFIANSTDLCNIFAPYVSGTKANTTNFIANSTDLCNIFAPYVVATVTPGWYSIGTFNNACLCVVSNTSGDVYIGGTFTIISGVLYSRLVKYSNGSLVNISSPSTIVLSLTTDKSNNSNIYYGGSNSSSRTIQKYNGTSWTTLSYTPNDDVRAITTDNNGILYFGGFFTNTYTRICRYDGTNITQVGSTGLQGNGCWALEVDSTNNLYAGGFFSSADSVSNTAYFAKWNGTVWSSLGTFNGNVYSITVDSNDNIYVCGDFTTPVNRIGRYNKSTSTWTSLYFNATGLKCVHYDKTNNILYCGGDFTSPYNKIAQYNGSSWSQIGSNSTSGLGPIFQITATGGYIYIAGEFPTYNGSSTMGYFARYKT